MRFTVAEKLLDLLFPRYCPVCGKKLSNDERPLCLGCNIRIPRFNTFSHPTDNLLAKQFYGKADLEHVSAFMRFLPHTPMAELIYDGKYRGKPSVMQQLAVIAADEANACGFFDGIDAIVPIPITARRTLHRGYNQSECIAQGISQVTGLPIITDAVIRARFTVSQTALLRSERRENVEHAFACIAPERIKGKHILVVDDIITTGATTLSCINEIRQKTDCRISLFALGRTSIR